MSGFTQRPVLMALVVCGILVVALVLWIALGGSGMPNDVYKP